MNLHFSDTQYVHLFGYDNFKTGQSKNNAVCFLI